MKHVTIGIDPGAKGGVAWVGSDGSCGAWTVDTKDIKAVLKCLNEVPVADKTAAAVEYVWGRGGWGAASIFSLGGAFWTAKAALDVKEIPFAEIIPRDWQEPIWTERGEGIKDSDERKAHLITVAQRLYPAYEFASGQADAILIARFQAHRVFRTKML